MGTSGISRARSASASAHIPSTQNDSPFQSTPDDGIAPTSSPAAKRLDNRIASRATTPAVSHGAGRRPLTMVPVWNPPLPPTPVVIAPPIPSGFSRKQFEDQLLFMQERIDGLHASQKQDKAQLATLIKPHDKSQQNVVKQKADLKKVSSQLDKLDGLYTELAENVADHDELLAARPKDEEGAGREGGGSQLLALSYVNSEYGRADVCLAIEAHLVAKGSA